MNRYIYLLYYSCLKTLAHKHHCKISDIKERYGYQDISIPNKKSDKLTDQRICTKYTLNRKIKWQTLINWKELDSLLGTNRIINLNRTKPDTIDFKLMDRINFRTKFKTETCCCMCGSEDRIEMHHKDPVKAKKTDKAQWNFLDLIGRNLGRQQLPVCHTCHTKIHNGEIQRSSVKEIFSLAAIVPESLLNTALKSENKLLISADQRATADRDKDRAQIKRDYPVVINEPNRTYYNANLHRHIQYKANKRINNGKEE